MYKIIVEKCICSLKKAFLLTVCLILFSGCSDFKSIKLFLPPTWVNMHNIAPNVYVDQDMTKTQREDLLNQISQARKNVSDVWGTVTANSEIYACSTNKCFENLGGVSAAAHAKANHILLAPRGLNTEIISHEYSHTELYERIGGFFNRRKIPSWFDEGVAVLTGHDPRHDEKAWKKIKDQRIPHPTKKELYKLKTVSQWNAAFHYYNKGLDLNTIVVIYAAAGHEVSQWYEKFGSKGLCTLVEKIKNGNSFEKTYYENR